jgi:hypothetical protein
MEDKSIHNDDHPAHLPIILDDEILIEISDQNSRIKSLLVGMNHNQYIIAKIFPNDLVGVFNSEGIKKSPISVMYRYKGAVYRFDTTIQHVVTYPDRLFFLKYPEQVKKHCIPEKIRHQCNLPSQTMLGNDIIEMDIVDISQYGCQCTIKTAGEEDNGLYKTIHVDKRIDIMVQFQGSEERYDLVGIIRNVSKDINKIQIGIMFGQMPQVARKRVEDYIAVISKAEKKSSAN